MTELDTQRDFKPIHFTKLRPVHQRPRTQTPRTHRASDPLLLPRWATMTILLLIMVFVGFVLGIVMLVLGFHPPAAPPAVIEHPDPHSLSV